MLSPIFFYPTKRPFFPGGRLCSFFFRLRLSYPSFLPPDLRIVLSDSACFSFLCGVVFLPFLSHSHFFFFCPHFNLRKPRTFVSLFLPAVKWRDLWCVSRAPPMAPVLFLTPPPFLFVFFKNPCPALPPPQWTLHFEPEKQDKSHCFPYSATLPFHNLFPLRCDLGPNFCYVPIYTPLCFTRVPCFPFSCPQETRSAPTPRSSTSLGDYFSARFCPNTPVVFSEVLPQYFTGNQYPTHLDPSLPFASVVLASGFLL